MEHCVGIYKVGTNLYLFNGLAKRDFTISKIALILFLPLTSLSNN